MKKTDRKETEISWLGKRAIATSLIIKGVGLTIFFMHKVKLLF